MKVFLKFVIGLVAVATMLFVGKELLRGSLSHGPFLVEVKTGDRHLEGMIVTLTAYVGTMHGRSATYQEQQIAASGERIQFPRRFIQ